MNPEHKPITIEQRSNALKRARDFFYSQSIHEVDTNFITCTPNIDANVEPYKIGPGSYIITSPEIAMKQLLSIHKQDIYQLSHVVRKNEEGEKHQTEFTMCEWYCVDISFNTFISQVIDFISQFISIKNTHQYTYRDIFKKHTSLDCTSCSLSDLVTCLKNNQIQAPTNITHDDMLQFVFSSVVEPRLTQLTVVYDYPIKQSALANVDPLNGVAKRFEIYLDNLEVANGYDELTDAEEYKRRFKAVNSDRIRQNLPPLPISQEWLTLIDQLPNCCGVALGFDRLLMKQFGYTNIEYTKPLMSVSQ
ncbi:hypothetical protein N9N03_00065 [Chlamydiia bacterium]|nr:hypothetical protein [Chlamydiia bacterium]